MGLKVSKIEKLKIDAYKDEKRQGSPLDSFEAMFNPTEISQRFAITWGGQQGANANGKRLHFSYSKPSDLNLKLTLDGTNVDVLPSGAAGRQSVTDRVQAFMKVAYQYDGALHEPRYLRVTWGKLSFDCRLSSVDVSYSLFDRDGTPLRANLSIVLIADASADKLAKEANKQSPDLTHARVVRGGDTLPLLTKEIYGSSERYLDVARYNGLKNFRKLEPGKQILFPPLTALDADKGVAERG